MGNALAVSTLNGGCPVLDFNFGTCVCKSAGQVKGLHGVGVLVCVMALRCVHNKRMCMNIFCVTVC